MSQASGPARKRRTLPPDDRRATILAAARAVFVERGYEQARIAEIAQRAGIAQGTFYLYFASKSEAYLALTESVTRDLEEAALEAASAADGLAEAVDRAVEAAFAAASAHRDVLAAIVRGPLLREVRAQTGRLSKPFYAAIAELLERAKRDGETPAVLDPDVVAPLLHGVVDWAVHLCFVWSDGAKAALYQEETRRFLRRSLGLPE